MGFITRYVQFAGLLESLSRLAVPKRELTLLQPSTSIGKHQRTKKYELSGVSCAECIWAGCVMFICVCVCLVMWVVCVTVVCAGCLLVRLTFSCLLFVVSVC